MYQDIKIFVKDRIGTIVLDRPEKRNALNEGMVVELKSAIEKMNTNPEVKVVMIQAAGKDFCSGADLEYLKKLQSHTFEQNLNDSKNLKDLFYQIYTSPKVFIAQIRGHALAGGCGLASVCDFSFAAPEAKFGYTEVKIGFIPAIVMSFLVKKIGEGKARHLLLEGNLISAIEALELGMISSIVEDGQMEEKATGFAKKLISQNSEEAMAVTKMMLANIQGRTLEEGLHYSAYMNAKARGSDDCKKGIDAFLNKKPLEW